MQRYTLFFSYKNMIFRSEPRKEIEIATNKITTMFLNFDKSEPQRSYKHGSYQKKKVYAIMHLASLLTKLALSFYQIDFTGLFSFSSLDMLRIRQLFI